jgi:endonuclease/exonuclease/phosphatase (EEP) superfamily protein YafD
MQTKVTAPAVVAALACAHGLACGEAEPARAAPAPARAPELTVMSYNVNYGTRGRADTMDAIAAGDADVVLLQETTASWEKALRKRFKDRYAHMVFHNDDRAAGGFAVLSRHAIHENEILPPAEGWFPAQRITLDTPLGVLDVLHLHLRPAISNGSWIKGYFDTPPIRIREITEYWKKLKRIPAIVAGDFNEEPEKGVAQFLADKGLRRVPTGGTPTTWSWSGTYQGHPVELNLDIDHVVVDQSLTATNATVLDAGQSDHRPVLVTLTRPTS